MSEKDSINDQERLLGPENGYIEGLKKIGEEDFIMKHGLWVFVHKRGPKRKKMGWLSDLGALNEKTEPKFGIYKINSYGLHFYYMRV